MLSQIPEQPAEKIMPLVVVCESFDVAEVLLNDLYYFFGVLQAYHGKEQRQGTKIKYD